MADKHTYRARREGFRARSVYKLAAMDKKYRLFSRSDTVLDIGCWPGSWLQYLSDRVRKAVGVDQLEIEPIAGVTFLQADIFDETLCDKIKAICPRYNVILSDIAPATSGNKSLDQQRSIAMVEIVLGLVPLLLGVNGRVLVKVFQSGEVPALLVTLRRMFGSVKVVKPDVSRKRSMEIYILARNYTGVPKFSGLNADCLL